MLKKAELKEIVNEVVSTYNPYIAHSVKFNVDKVEKYIYRDNVYTKEELDAEYAKTAEKDIMQGYKERMVGYYDKWYRYNHMDEGRAYDFGVRRATQEPNCVDYLHLIECNQ